MKAICNSNNSFCDFSFITICFNSVFINFATTPVVLRPMCNTQNGNKVLKKSSNIYETVNSPLGMECDSILNFIITWVSLRWVIMRNKLGQRVDNKCGSDYSDYSIHC